MSNEKLTISKFKLSQAHCKGSALWILVEFMFIVLNIAFFGGVIQKWFLAQAPAINNAQTMQTNLEKGLKKKVGHINILLLGVDSVEGTHRSDTILVMGINPEKAKVSLISIPRDSRVLIEGRARKMNEILPRYGEAALSKLLEDLMQIQISRFVKIDFQAFTKIIDIAGGVEVNIVKDMNYDDTWGKVHIHFKKGLQHLNGKQSLEYVRYRGDALADLGRIKRQQKFIKLLIKKTLTPSFVVKLPQIIKEAYKYIKTDFTLPEIYLLTSSFSSFKVELKSASLPGEARYIDKISYFLPYKDKAIDIGLSYFSDLVALELVASFTPSITASGSINEN